jgi:hypothetical protein
MIDIHKLKLKTVLVFDFGSQIAVAQRLSKDFGRVLYYIPSVTNGFKDHKAHGIGRGIEGVERVDDWWDYYNEIDLFVFTDIYMGGLQQYLRMQGKAVFGGGKASEMESNRLQFLQLVESLELPTLKYDVAKGVEELDEKLKNVTDKYIKSSLRGDFETTHYVNYVLFQTELKRLKHDMGVYAEDETYLICDPIEAIGEIGYDGFVVDGMYPKESCCGIEIKDAGYIGKIVPYSNLPKQIKIVNDKFSDVFRSYGYRAAFSSEVRIDSKKDGYFIDPTLRFPEPNTALTLEMYTNYSQIIYEVAIGIVPEIQYRYKWGCELIIKSELAKTEPIAVQFPKKYADNVKLKNLVIDKDGVHWVTPNNVEMCEIGAVVAMGDSMEEAIKNAVKIAETVKGHDLKIGTSCMEEAKEQIANLNKHGIKFI